MTALLRSRSAATLFSLALLLLLLSPIRENYAAQPVDSFPLSYFPMFSHDRGETYKTSYVVGLTADAERITVPYRYIGSGGFNQTRRQLRKIIHDGGSARLCDQVAERVARSSRKSFQDVVEIQVLEGRYVLDDYFIRQDKTPDKEKQYAACPVEGEQS